MARFDLTINKKSYSTEAEPGTPLLWVMRDNLGLTGTKYGCGIGQCGACTIHLNGVALRSCQLPIEGVVGQEITTIEGISDDASHPVQQAWIEEDVPQCGYCQGGQIMSAIALLKLVADPSDTDINTHMAGNLCRCGTYPRIRKAIKLAAKTKKGVETP